VQVTETVLVFVMVEVDPSVTAGEDDAVEGSKEPPVEVHGVVGSAEEPGG
jgi:hypothetical protein